MTTSRAPVLPRRRAARAAAVLGDPRWAALSRRDAAADGLFLYSVASTGVYCRPSCAARLPRPDNVTFHANAEAARAAGFRPCRRCRPDDAPLAEQRARRVAELCEVIDASPEPPRLEELARRSGWSPYHLQRVFRSVTGLTPAAYAAARRAERVRVGLTAGESVTRTLYAAGFNSSGPFYAAAGQALGMTPSDYRRGGKDQRIRFAVGQCTLGAILVAASEHGVCAITLGDEPEALVRDLERRFPAAELLGGDSAFEQLVATVVGFVEAPDLGLALPLDLRGTLFQERVWRALAQIPPGATTTYTEIAERIGAPRAVRAVARACADNRLAVAIPCHRVVRKDGGLSGYRWGIERKRSLLAREAEAAGPHRPAAAAQDSPKAAQPANVLDET